MLVRLLEGMLFCGRDTWMKVRGTRVGKWDIHGSRTGPRAKATRVVFNCLKKVVMRREDEKLKMRS